MKPAPIDFASYIGPGYFLRLAALGRAFKGLHGAGFLEIGPGRGDLAAWLIARGGRGTLVDTSESSIEYLSKRFRNNPAITIHDEDAASMADRTGCFDLAIALEVLEHVPDDLSLLGVMHSMLKPGGTLVISVPAFMRRWGELDECVGHLRRYERADISRLLSDAGFPAVELYCYGYPVCVIFSLLRKIYYVKALRKLRNESADLRTGRSGVERPLNVRSRVLVRVVYTLMMPMILIQSLTLRSSLGEGWIAVAEKSREGESHA